MLPYERLPPNQVTPTSHTPKKESFVTTYNVIGGGRFPALLFPRPPNLAASQVFKNEQVILESSTTLFSVFMMAFYHGNERDKTDYRSRDEENFSSMYSGRVESPRLEHEKKLRREIANSNERRRMQSINAGFQSLRALLPKTEGDKLSKAAILQGTVDYLHQLEQEKSFLMSQNMKLSRSVQSSNDSDGSCCNDLPLPKRKRRKIDLHLVDEGIGSASPSSQSDTECDAKHEIAQLRKQLEQERAWRLRLEEELKEREVKGGKTIDHDYTEQDVKPKVLPLPPFHHITPVKDNSSPLNLQIGNPRPIPTYPYDACKPRQNLAAIVEAIRHVEGYHMFQDDSSPVNSPKSSEETTTKSSEETTIEGLSFESKIIRSAPVVQNRAGVIVSNTS